MKREENTRNGGREKSRRVLTENDDFDNFAEDVTSRTTSFEFTLELSIVLEVLGILDDQIVSSFRWPEIDLIMIGQWNILDGGIVLAFAVASDPVVGDLAGCETRVESAFQSDLMTLDHVFSIFNCHHHGYCKITSTKTGISMTS